jgi:hypothetical protein
MKILSIDCGLKNLAYCVLDFEDTSKPKIVHWEVYDIQAKSFEDIPVALIRSLDSRKTKWDQCEIVMIERQPQKNRKMVILQNILHAYFLIRGTVDLNTVKKVQIVSALHKLGHNGDDIHGKKNYSQRKKMSVIMAQEFLKEHGGSPFVELFAASSKKDDLADSLNQGLHCFKYSTVPEPACVPPNVRYSNIRPRKPTDKQVSRGYSPANIMYFYNEHKEDFAAVLQEKKHAKWNKAVVKWFGTTDECLLTFQKQKSVTEP